MRYNLSFIGKRKSVFDAAMGLLSDACGWFQGRSAINSEEAVVLDTLFLNIGANEVVITFKSWPILLATYIVGDNINICIMCCHKDYMDDFSLLYKKVHDSKTKRLLVAATSHMVSVYGGNIYM